MINEFVKGISKNGTTEPSREALIKNVLPNRSDKNPNTIKPMIKPMITIDNARLDTDTDTPNVSTNTGSSGCTAYNAKNIKKEASARLIVIFLMSKSLIQYLPVSFTFHQPHQSISFSVFVTLIDIPQINIGGRNCNCPATQCRPYVFLGCYQTTSNNVNIGRLMDMVYNTRHQTW